MTKQSGVWQHLPDFDHLTWESRSVCSNCGSAKRRTESGIFRPNTLDDFSGFPDLCEGCVVEAADMLGLVSADNTGALQAAQQEVCDLLEELRAARDALATVTRENVRLQEVIDDLSKDPDFDDLDDYLAAEDEDD